MIAQQLTAPPMKLVAQWLNESFKFKLGLKKTELQNTTIARVH